jgi:glycosyltransferase involved in cell wall biosynthesis
MTSLVSIIIPTYNRAHLINQTLDSILAQTFQNWECIIVDDGSVDNTKEIIGSYIKTDSRIKYFERPKNRTKGANACRNFGLEQSKGNFVQWFDSDDLMTPEALELKLKYFTKKLDFVIAESINFQNGQFLEPYAYHKNPRVITFEDFIFQRTFWLTYDVLLRRSLANQVAYNEELKYWQDYNYFCKMLLHSTNGTFIEKILTHRRLHENSIQSDMLQNKLGFSKKLLNVVIITFIDVSENVSKKNKIELIHWMMNLSFQISKNSLKIPQHQFVNAQVRQINGLNSSFWFSLSLLSNYLFSKGHYFLRKAKNKL